jgi:hypothetical protein
MSAGAGGKSPASTIHGKHDFPLLTDVSWWTSSDYCHRNATIAMITNAGEIIEITFLLDPRAER